MKIIYWIFNLKVTGSFSEVRRVLKPSRRLVGFELKSYDFCVTQNASIHWATLLNVFLSFMSFSLYFFLGLALMLLQSTVSKLSTQAPHLCCKILEYTMSWLGHIYIAWILHQNCVWDYTSSNLIRDNNLVCSSLVSCWMKLK